MPKRLNPPNFPHARPIGNFRGCLAQKVYEGGWDANMEKLLIRCVESKMKEFDTNFVESLLEPFKYMIGDNGVYALFN